METADACAPAGRLRDHPSRSPKSYEGSPEEDEALAIEVVLEEDASSPEEDDVDSSVVEEVLLDVPPPEEDDGASPPVDDDVSKPRGPAVDVSSVVVV
jgi:hypothetical protein